MAVLILLPPSEGKSAPSAGAPLDLLRLSHPELAPSRQRVGDALVRVSGQRNALAVLGAGKSLTEEVARNTHLWDGPADAAARVYSGVLYDAAGMNTWDDAAIARSADRVRIFSALWGAVSPADRIPAYRLSAGTTLGRVGGMAPFWRSRLGEPLATLSGSGLVVDCRSSGYAAFWTAPKASTVFVRVERELDGGRAVVSHFAKHWRGLLTARLLAQPDDPESPHDVVDIASGIPGVTATELVGNRLTLVVT